MSDPAPIGVFDSGLGGLSVAREIHDRLPNERLVYFADAGNCPYGGRTLDEVRTLSLAASHRLAEEGIKMLVVACNTATAAALEDLRERLGIPVVGLEPALKPAARLTETGRVAVLATPTTLQTERFQRLVRSYGGGVTLYPVAGAGLVELVEAGKLEGEETTRVLDDVLAPLRGRGIDAVVLGCTHYPFLRPEIERELGPRVRVIDSGEAVARRIERVLADYGIASGGEPWEGPLRMLATGDADWVQRVAERLWGGEVVAQPA